MGYRLIIQVSASCSGTIAHGIVAQFFPRARSDLRRRQQDMAMDASSISANFRHPCQPEIMVYFDGAAHAA
eukprot:2197487-Pyramimonas_sp.AAC.1